MDCPYCNFEMKKGLLSGGDSLCWYSTEGSFWDRERFYLDIWAGPKIMGAYYCELCSKIILDLDCKNRIIL